MATPGSRAGEPKSYHAQIERRQDKAAEWRLAGYAVDQIARALGVAVTTVTEDLKARSYRLRDAPKVIGASRRRPHDPEPFDWKSEPPPAPPPPGYVLSSFVPRAESLLNYLRETNARNRFAFSIDEAEAAGDEKFIVGSQVVLAELGKYVRELQEIAQHAHVQEQAKRPEARDDLRNKTVPFLRNSSANAVSLPEPGTGVPPGRVYASLWRYSYAGIEITDEIVEHIANQSGLAGHGGRKNSSARIARIWAAVEEMRAAGLIK